ncbi:MAG: ABC transporter ATP-binding protein [Spirochaetales bacterium]|nr:ABC transporter ATP-binding protein [Spirochaetales bacterium]
MLEHRYRNKNPLKSLYYIYQGNFKPILLALLLCIVKHSPMIVMPVVIGNIINIITNPKLYSIDDIWLNLIVVSVFLLQNIPLHTLYTKFSSTAIREVEVNLRYALVKRMQELSMSFHDNFASGILHSKVLRDVESIELLSRQMFNTGFQSMLTIVFSFGITLYKNPFIALFFAGTIPIAVFLIRIFKGKISQYNSEFRTEIEKMSARVSDMVSMIPVTRAHGLEEVEIERVSSQLIQVKDKGKRLDVVNAVFASSAWVTFNLFQIGCLTVTGFMALNGLIPIGDVVMYQGFFGMIIGSINTILSFYPQFSRGFESLRSIGEILECPDIEHNKGKKKIDKLTGNIRFEQVSFTYSGTGIPSVKDLSFDIREGESVAFVGASGAGKSTIVRLVIGFHRLETGTIYIDGTDIRRLDMRTVRSHMAVVPQDVILFSGSIRDNILYGAKRISKSRLEEAMDSANVTEFVQTLPDGLETMVGENGAKLSGGQRQRIAIARALIRDPRIIIFDEATSALDVTSEKLIQDAVRKMIRGRTTLIVSHRLSSIRFVDRIIVMKKGSCVESGSYNKLLEQNGIFARLVKNII